MMDDVAKVKALTRWSLNTLASARHAGGHEAAVLLMPRLFRKSQDKVLKQFSSWQVRC